jgi:hypothetical protein
MTTGEVIALLEKNRDERGIQNWKKVRPKGSRLQSFGVGLTRLRKLAKQIGRDHELALALWKSKYYEAKVLALLVDEPKKMTRAQVERQVEKLQGGHLAHVFSSCGATLAKTTFVRELADDWMKSKDPVRVGCGYGLLYEMSKSTKKSAPDDDYFLKWIRHMRRTYKKQSNDVVLSMGGALLGIGKRNKALNAAALEVARLIGPIVFDETGKCDPLDVEKHLTSPYLTKKLGL